MLIYAGLMNFILGGPSTPAFFCISCVSGGGGNSVILYFIESKHQKSVGKLLVHKIASNTRQ